MKLIENELYHIYNQGNNQEIIFRDSKDYLRFLTKYRILAKPFCETISYCLMPNHFHFLIKTNKNSVEKFKLGGIEINKLSNGFRLLQSEYAKEINQKYERSGSLFRQKTQGKIVSEIETDYANTCFFYIHQNPWIANIVQKLEDWDFSSFKDYAGFRNGTLCNLDLGKTLFFRNSSNFVSNSYEPISNEKIKFIY